MKVGGYHLNSTTAGLNLVEERGKMEFKAPWAPQAQDCPPLVIVLITIKLIHKFCPNSVQVSNHCLRLRKYQ